MLILKTLKMINDGLSSIQFNNRHDYQKRVPKNAIELSRENWKNIGDRLNKAIKTVDYK